MQASKTLLDLNKVLPAVILAALASEIFLKSFLAEGDTRGKARTKRGHTLVDLFKKVQTLDKLDLETAFRATKSEFTLEDGLKKFNNMFLEARYFYEPEAPPSVGSDIVHFSDDLCQAVFKVAQQRGV